MTMTPALIEQHLLDLSDERVQSELRHSQTDMILANLQVTYHQSMQYKHKERGASEADRVEQQPRDSRSDEGSQSECGGPHAWHQTVCLYGVREAARTAEEGG